MGKGQMTLLGAAGFSTETLAVMIRRVYMTDDADQVQWQGRLHVPAIHALYQTHLKCN
jgi:hypothetical protein